MVPKRAITPRARGMAVCRKGSDRDGEGRRGQQERTPIAGWPNTLAERVITTDRPRHADHLKGSLLALQEP